MNEWGLEVILTVILTIALGVHISMIFHKD